MPSTLVHDGSEAFRGAVVVPRFAHDPGWPWLTGIPPLDACDFDVIRIGNRLHRLGPLTRVWRMLQHRRAARRIRDVDVAFLFSTDIGIAVARRSARRARPRLVYVGFTQDARWPEQRQRLVGAALRACDAVTVFTEAERRIYADRYRLDADRLHVVPITIDAPEPPNPLPPGPSPHHVPYAVSLGVTNRRFEPAAQACREAGIPLVVLTRPAYGSRRLRALESLGVRVVTDADQPAAWRFLQHARLAILQFEDHGLPAGFTTVMNAMFLGTPVIAGPSIGMDEHVVDGVTGLMTPADDVRVLRDAVTRLWRDEAFARALAEAARARADRLHARAAAAPRHHAIACALLGVPVGLDSSCTMSRRVA